MARELYIEWGAVGKAEDLSKRFTFLRPKEANLVTDVGEGIIEKFLSLQLTCYQGILSFYEIRFKAESSTIIIDYSNNNEQIVLNSLKKELKELPGIKIEIQLSEEEIKHH